MDKKNNTIKYVLITISVLFVGIMLVLPLIAIIINSLQKGWSLKTSKGYLHRSRPDTKSR